MAGKGIGIPLKLLHEAEGFVVTVGPLSIDSATALVAPCDIAPQHNHAPVLLERRRFAQ